MWRRPTSLTIAPSSAFRDVPERYRVQARLAAGAQGETFAVVDAHDGAERVLKLFAPGLAGQGSALAEFRNLEGLVHPTIVRVRDIGRARTDACTWSPIACWGHRWSG